MATKKWKNLMPTYDYKCLECSHTFEEFQKITDKPIEICPECGGKLKRLIGPGADPIFKGSGFYQTDYKVSPSEKSKKQGSRDKTNDESAKSVKKSPDKKSNEA